MAFLDFLEPGVTRRLAQSFIQKGISQQQSANWIQNTLQKSGLGYRRTTMLSDVRYWKEAFTRGERMKFTTMDARLGQDRYMSTNWRMGSRYETVFRSKLRDPLTGEVHDQFVTIKHEHLEDGVIRNDLTQTKTRRELQEVAEEYYKKYGVAVENIVAEPMPVMGFFNPSVH
ncbi:unnamed protein product [marine sediment metagenome]|uniref:Uncharacterized protein n=1 Tax=marine sediment metagenome TaxID=412755 RepID=X1PZ60_9ZZZZ